MRWVASWNDFVSLPFEVSMHSQLRHLSTRLQYSHRLRYRLARLLVIWLPLGLVLYALVLVVASRTG